MVQIKYALLNSNWIYNLCGPERLPVGWTPFKIEKRHQATLDFIRKRNEKDGFYEKLEASILNEGFRNPIIVSVGLFSTNYLSMVPNPTRIRSLIERIPPRLRTDLPNLLTCERWGGSRLWIAQKHNLKIPCIINDFVDAVGDAEILQNIDDVMKKFQDVPNTVDLGELGVSMSGWIEGGTVRVPKNKTYKIKYAVLPSHIIRNQLYPNEKHQAKLESKNQFFSKLEKSILREGFRNPIIVTAIAGDITNRYGGSRLMIAQKHGMDIPCIIADFDNIFPDAKQIQPDEMKSYFTDPPMALYLLPHGINASGCEHVHLKDKT